MKILVAATLMCMSLTAFAQIEYSSFTSTGRGGATSFVTDYQAVGINPANLGWTWKFEDKKIAVGLNEMSYSIHSDALSKDEIRDEFSYAIKHRSFSEFTYEDKINAAKSFTDAGVALNIDYGSIGAAFTGDKLGGLAFRINDHFHWYSQLGQQASDLIFLGKTSSYFDSLVVVYGGDTSVIANDTSLYNYDTTQIISGFRNIPQQMSQILSDSRLSMQWYREYNVSYGRKIFEVDSVIAFYGGVGVKFLQGIALLEIQAPDGNLEAFSAISPFFNIDYGTDAAYNPSATGPQEGFLPNAVGRGWGFDLGFNAVLFNKLKIGLAINNIGSITWDGNVYTVQDTLLASTQSGGLESYNLFNSFEDLTGDNGYLKWSGTSKKVVQLPTVVRFGASLNLGKIAEIGFDMIIPTNDVPGSYEKPIIGFGGDIRPIPWLELQAGFMTGGNYDFSIPVGLIVRAPGGTYEMGIASRDAITFFTQNGPTLSLSFGFLRFRF